MFYVEIIKYPAKLVELSICT